jgi:hypothetical protein
MGMMLSQNLPEHLRKTPKDLMAEWNAIRVWLPQKLIPVALQTTHGPHCALK